MRPAPLALLALLAAALPQSGASAAGPAPDRIPDEAVNSVAVRTRPGLEPGDHLLFNGWGITPAGDAVDISDMPLHLVIAPDHRTLVAVSGGYNDTGVTLIDLATRRVTQFLPLRECWNGLAFGRDGRRLSVSGGDSGNVHVFDFAAGHATARPAGDESVADVLRRHVVHEPDGREHQVELNHHHHGGP